MNIKQTALQFISNKKSIIPVKKDKVPYIKWQEFQQRVATVEEVEKWWTLYPDAQLGLITGKINNITVVDVEQGGDFSKYPKTTTSKTGGGGRHYFYKYHPNYNNKARIAPLTDIRGEGGYVVVSPSETTKGKYEWLSKTEMVDFPDYLFQKTGEKQVQQQISTNYSGFGEGQRNDEMTKYIGHLLAKIHPTEWDTIAWQEAERANSKNTPPITQRELQNIFKSITSTERNNNKTRWYKQQQKIAETPDDDIDIVLMKDATERSGEYTEAYPLGFPIFDNEMKGGVRAGDLVVLTGISGRGKTMFIQNITANITKEGLPAIWFSYEMLIDNLYARFKDIVGDLELPIYTPQKTVSGSIDWIEKKIKKAIEENFAHFVFIDHIDFLQPKKFTGADQRRIILKDICQELKDMAVKNKVVIFLIAHVKKVQGREVEMQDVAESSGIYQLCDYLISVDRKTETVNQDGIQVEIMSNTSIAKMLKNRISGTHPFMLYTVQNNKIVTNQKI